VARAEQEPFPHRNTHGPAEHVSAGLSLYILTNTYSVRTLGRGCVISVCWCMNRIEAPIGAKVLIEPVAVSMRYCFYARKSTKSEDAQILSIDSQIKEMLKMAEREYLEVVEV